jgi:hypothetical protein
MSRPTRRGRTRSSRRDWCSLCLAGGLAAACAGHDSHAALLPDHGVLAARSGNAGNGIAYFDTGRFIADGGRGSSRDSVQHGVFSSHVRIDNLTIGETSFHAQLDEIIEVGAVRIYDADDDGRFRLLSDNDIAYGGPSAGPVRFALARDLDPDRYRTALDVMQGRTLGHMIASDGSRPVRIDAMLAVPIYDNKPGAVDGAPEVLLFGELRHPQVLRVTAIIGGSPDEPLLGPKTAVLTAGDFNRGRTGVTMIMSIPPDVDSELPVRISIVGLDLYAHLGLDAGVEARGVRIEIPPFEDGQGSGDQAGPAVIGVIGACTEIQRAFAHDQPIVDEPQDIGLALGSGSGRGASGGAWGGGGSGGWHSSGSRGGGGGGSGGPGISSQPQLPADNTLPKPVDNDNDPGTSGGGDFAGNNGNGGGGGGGGNGGGAPVPAPATLPLFTLALLLGRRRARAS